MKRMAVISAGFVPVPAVDGGAGEVLTTEIIEGNEAAGDYYMDIYTIASEKLDGFHYQNAEIIQIHISKWNWFFCKFRNMFLKAFRKRYRFIPYNRKLLKVFKDNYDMILVENNMQVFEDIYHHAKHGTDSMIYHMHNDIDGSTKPECLCRFIADKGKVILPVSNYIKEHFYQAAPNDKMKVLYNCIDFTVFDVKKEVHTKSLREKYGIEEGDFVFLYTGRICPEKGVLELVRAFRCIYKNYPQVKLMIVGSRWYNLIEKDAYFEQLISESEACKDRIIFTGYVFPKDMPSVYLLGDVLVIPTMCEEAFGVVALEGMAMKLPIIATNSGGMTELLPEGTAIVVNKNENVVKELEQAMKKLLLDKSLREKLAHKAYVEVHADSRYNKENYYNNFKKLLDEADRNTE